MAITVDVTVGGAAANSYVTTVETDAHAEETIWDTDWTAGTQAEKDQLVVRATRAIDTMRHRSRPNSDTQALQYPRADAEKPSGTLWSTTAIPQPLKTATMHVAAWLASFATTADPWTPPADLNIKSRTLPEGVGAYEYFGAPQNEGDGFLSDIIAPMLRPHGLLGAAGSVTLLR